MKQNYLTKSQIRKIKKKARKYKKLYDKITNVLERYKMIKYLIAGSRDFNNYNLLLQVLSQYKKPDIIIEGGARGADLLGKRFAKDNNIECQEYKANWKKFEKSAGYRRNAEMVNQLDKNDIAFIFWDGKSKGTKHTIDLCNKKNIKTIITYF